MSLNIIGTVGDTLEPLINLMKLNLSDNYITSLPRNAFHALSKLSTLDVSNNTIVEIGKIFLELNSLILTLFYYGSFSHIIGQN